MLLRTARGVLGELLILAGTLVAGVHQRNPGFVGPEEEPEDEENGPIQPVTVSEKGFRMVAQPHPRPDRLEPQEGPLKGSLADRARRVG